MANHKNLEGCTESCGDTSGSETHQTGVSETHQAQHRTMRQWLDRLNFMAAQRSTRSEKKIYHLYFQNILNYLYIPIYGMRCLFSPTPHSTPLPVLASLIAPTNNPENPIPTNNPEKPIPTNNPEKPIEELLLLLPPQSSPPLLPPLPPPPPSTASHDTDSVTGECDGCSDDFSDDDMFVMEDSNGSPSSPNSSPNSPSSKNHLHCIIVDWDDTLMATTVLISFLEAQNACKKASVSAATPSVSAATPSVSAATPSVAAATPSVAAATPSVDSQQSQLLPPQSQLSPPANPSQYYPAIPSSILSMEFAQHYAQALALLEKRIILFLEVIQRLGDVYIITNSEKGWVQLSCEQYIPSVWNSLKKFPIISARSCHDTQYPGNPYMWKYLAFQECIQPYHKFLMSFGDSPIDHKVAEDTGRLHQLQVKNIKFKLAPSFEDLHLQLSNIIPLLSTIHKATLGVAAFACGIPLRFVMISE